MLALQPVNCEWDSTVNLICGSERVYELRIRSTRCVTACQSTCQVPKWSNVTFHLVSLCKTSGARGCFWFSFHNYNFKAHAVLQMVMFPVETASCCRDAHFIFHLVVLVYMPLLLGGIFLPRMAVPICCNGDDFRTSTIRTR